MPLHDSLTELAELAPGCPSAAAAKGILAESFELARNAWVHRTDASELTDWFSALVAGVLTSPAVAALSDGVAPTPTGPLACRDALPAASITWLDDTQLNHVAITELLSSVGLNPSVEKRSPVMLLDASVTTNSPIDQAALLERAISHRPAPLQSVDGLPDRRTRVDIRSGLLVPVADLARWGAGEAAGTHASTPERLTIAEQTGALDPNEVQALCRARSMGLSLGWSRWFDRVHDDELILDQLPALSRSAYGEASRTIASVIRSVAARQGVEIPGKEVR